MPKTPLLAQRSKSQSGKAGSAADPPPAADPTVNGKAGSGAELSKARRYGPFGAFA